MSNVSVSTLSNMSKRNVIEYIRSIFSSDLVFIKYLFMGVFAWWLLAQTSIYIFPDISGKSSKNSLQYLRYVIRNVQFYIFFLVAFIPFKLLAVAKNLDVGQPLFSYLKDRGKEWLAGPKKEILGVPAYFILAMAVFAVYLFTYSTIKTRVPNFIPFKWDETFMKMDRILFLGKDPWQYFSFLYDHPKIIIAMDFVYDFWAVILVSAWFFSFRFGEKGKARRYQFILALMLTWFIGGNVLAILLSTAGPVYFEALTGLPSTFGDQMAALSAINAETPLRALEYQAFLWEVYQGPGVGLGGIAAMPSMHNASALLLFLMFGRTAITRLIFGAFLLLIFISSFVLAWHYAVDGLFAVPVTLLCWKLAGWVVKKAGVPSS